MEISVTTATADRVAALLDEEPTIGTDSLINLALDAFEVLQDLAPQAFAARLAEIREGFCAWFEADPGATEVARQLALSPQESADGTDPRSWSEADLMTLYALWAATALNDDGRIKDDFMRGMR